MAPVLLIKKQWYLILSVTLFLISCCDLGATLYFDRTYDDFEEANPIALYIWDNHGVIGLTIFKMTITMLSCFCVSYILINKRRSLRIIASLLGLIIGNLIIGWWILWLFS